MAVKKTKQGITPEQKSIADRQIREKRRLIGYDQRDFTVAFIVQEFINDLFYIPDYQREYIWLNQDKARFIESVLLGLPIPLMFFADMDDGRLEIVDGAQRIQTLESFLNDDFVLIDMKKLTTLNDFRYSDLPLAQQRKFRSHPLRIVILEDDTTEELRQEIFDRVNTSGKRARPAEVRRGAYTGPFADFVKLCAKNELFGRLCPISNAMRARREPEELVLRFFAYSERYRLFKHNVTSFLNKYMDDNRDKFDRKRLVSEFDSMLHFVDRNFEYGFAKKHGAKSTPRVRFEAIAVGVNLALREKPDLVSRDMDWLESDEFKYHTTTHASNSGPRLRGRIEYVRDKLLKGSG